MDRLKGKVAIVTGSTSGIGVGIAKLYAAEGAKVVICGRRAEKGQAVVDEIAAAGGEAYYHFMDMTQMDSIDKLFADTEEKYGKIDILVNNAANVGLKDGRVVRRVDFTSMYRANSGFSGFSSASIDDISYPNPLVLPSNSTLFTSRSL